PPKPATTPPPSCCSAMATRSRRRLESLFPPRAQHGEVSAKPTEGATPTVSDQPEASLPARSPTPGPPPPALRATSPSRTATGRKAPALPRHLVDALHVHPQGQLARGDRGRG